MITLFGRIGAQSMRPSSTVPVNKRKACCPAGENKIAPKRHSAGTKQTDVTVPQPAGDVKEHLFESSQAGELPENFMEGLPTTPSVFNEQKEERPSQSAFEQSWEHLSEVPPVRSASESSFFGNEDNAPVPEFGDFTLPDPRYNLTGDFTHASGSSGSVSVNISGSSVSVSTSGNCGSISIHIGEDPWQVPDPLAAGGQKKVFIYISK